MEDIFSMSSLSEVKKNHIRLVEHIRVVCNCIRFFWRVVLNRENQL